MISDKEVANIPMARGGGIPVDEAVVTILETGRSVRSNPATGEYSMRIPMGHYTLQAEAYGYYPQTVEVSVGEDETINQTFILDPKPRGTIQGRIFDRYYGNSCFICRNKSSRRSKSSASYSRRRWYFIIPDILVGDLHLENNSRRI